VITLSKQKKFSFSVNDLGVHYWKAIAVAALYRNQLLPILCYVALSVSSEKDHEGTV